MLSFSCTRIGEQDLLLPFLGHIVVVTTVAGQGWLAGPKPSLDAPKHLASWRWLIKAVVSQSIFRSGCLVSCGCEIVGAFLRREAAKVTGVGDRAEDGEPENEG
jgi:hypothetical protein